MLEPPKALSTLPRQRKNLKGATMDNQRETENLMVYLDWEGSSETVSVTLFIFSFYYIIYYILYIKNVGRPSARARRVVFFVMFNFFSLL